MGSEKITRFYGCRATTTNSAKQHKLSKVIAELSDKQGRTKEFFSLYIPKNIPIERIISGVKDDMESVGIKSKDQSLMGKKKSLIKLLKQHAEISENGLAVFLGTYTLNGSEDLNIEELVPPQPIASYLYVVDDHFYLEPLREMLRDQRVVGLIALDSKEASFGVVRGGNIEIMEAISSGIPGKSGKGGQSQRRYERERDMEVSNFFHRVADYAAKIFLEDRKITQLIVGGPGPTKNDFYKGNYLNYQLKDAVIKLVDTQSACSQAMKEMFDKSIPELTNVCGPEERKTMQRLLIELNKENGLAIAGLDSVLNALNKGSVEVAITLDNSGLVETKLICKGCGLSKTQIVVKKTPAELEALKLTPCSQCRSVNYDMVEKDMVEVLEDAASMTDARVEVIFTESDEKAKLKALGGFAALLRYKTD